jgi:hypothetical protein
MLGTGLEFATGTTEDCQRLVARLFQRPEEVLDRYRTARKLHRTSDLVLVTAEHDPSGFDTLPRARYIHRLRIGLGRDGDAMIAALGIAHRSAHQVVSLPRESDAFWLIINRKSAMPVMVVLFAAPYASDADAHEPLIVN